MTRYYCSGFDVEDAFGHGLGDMFKNELKDTKSIVYIPGGADKIEKVKAKYVPAFRNHFKNAGIEFEEEIIITPDMDSNEAKRNVKNASFVMLMGGDPFKEKDLCEKLNIIDDLKSYDGIMLGFSAGAMLMSKYIIITPCSEEYPNFHIENGMNLDGISIYPHNNTSEEDYPSELIVGDETYQRDDLVKVSQEYGNFYLLQDNLRSDGLTDVSLIKSNNGNLEFYTENEGKIWVASNNVTLLKNEHKKVM